MNPQAADKSQVWVWVEHHQEKSDKVSLGLLSKARELCQQSGGGEVAAVLAVPGSQQLVTELIDHGSDKVYMASDPCLSPFDSESCALFMTKLIQSHQPEIVLWGATSMGREIASRVAAKLETGLNAHCIDLYVEEADGKSRLVSVVAGWGGNVTIKILCPHKRPQMATVNPGVFSPGEPEKRSGEVIPVEVENKASRLEVVEVVEEPEEAASLEKAEVVVVGGWGLSALGGLEAANELAKVLKGKVGGTRPAVDAGWISAEKMIGQSGVMVMPQLLITLGVSGAAQFATGILSSKLIVAVDKNPQAPIFEMADIGIVGDLKEVLPLLTEKIRAKN